MTHGSLFSGIGGFDLAAEWMGWENKFHCEWNEFGQKILKHYWPNAEQFTNIITTDFTKYANKIDILTGGFPCQPYSGAGKRLGKEDDRHLWPQMLRAIREIQPRWIVGENVYGLVNWSNGLVFHEVQTDLEAQGYEVTPFLLPACAVGAPHRRDRIWFVAYAKNNGCDKRGTEINEWEKHKPYNGEKIWNQFTTDGKQSNVANTNSNGRDKCNNKNEVITSKGRLDAQCDIDKSNGNRDVADTKRTRLEHRNKTRNLSSTKRKTSTKGSGFTNEFKANDNDRKKRWENFPTQSPICLGNDGVSNKLDGITFSKWRKESIKAAGNAIVPQVVFQIFNSIQQYENTNN
jgi:DNA (cytosine-5)-methyltransferase 1